MDWRKIVLLIILVAALMVAFSLDDPKYYGPGNIEPTGEGHPTLVDCTLVDC